MSIPFKEPIPICHINVSREKCNLTRLFNRRNVPKSEQGKLTLATWNIANLGVQDRNPEALEVIAHILKRFHNTVLGVGSIDFDNAIFNDKWKELDANLSKKEAVNTFSRYVNYHISDHRPIWIQLDVS
ncbi:MAG: hypothetical protein JEZ09_08800 [Salinivirgaceae bacterium]|nr:hypothetical protein [Salinivirgaceae bacterium]